MIACGFGFLANIHPKLEFGLEPKGRMGRLIDNIMDKIDFYDIDKERDTSFKGYQKLRVPLLILLTIEGR